MDGKQIKVPDHTAVRVALWRALHLQVDSAPYVFEDEIGLKLAAQDEEWHQRPDMHPERTAGGRASVVARARLIEDLVTEQAGIDVSQYVILGAGLDTFAQRRSDIASKMQIFEVDQPEMQTWKRQRLIDSGYGIQDWLKLVPVDFEAGWSWWEQLQIAGFDTSQPSVIASTGVTQYLSKDAVVATLRQVAQLAPGSTFAMTFLLPVELVDPEVRPFFEMSIKGAKESGTPFLSFFTPTEILELASEAGFREAKHVSGAELNQRYFTGRSDHLWLPSGEEFLIATT